MIILPFKFERINDTYVSLTNIAGESIFLSNSDFEAICDEQFDVLFVGCLLGQNSDLIFLNHILSE